MKNNPNAVCAMLAATLQCSRQCRQDHLTENAKSLSIVRRIALRPATCDSYKENDDNYCQYCKWNPSDPDSKGQCLNPRRPFLVDNQGEAYCQVATRLPTIAPTKHPSGTSMPTKKPVTVAPNSAGKNKEECLAHRILKEMNVNIAVGKNHPLCVPKDQAEEFLKPFRYVLYGYLCSYSCTNREWNAPKYSHRCTLSRTNSRTNSRTKS